MSKPVTVTIPHELGRAEARKRIEDGISRMGHQFDGVKLTKAWDGDRLSFSVVCLEMNHILNNQHCHFLRFLQLSEPFDDHFQ